MKQKNSDFFDRNIKNHASQRKKIYIYDLIGLLNLTSKPYHQLKRALKIFNNKKINMGCGATYLPEWINIDGNFTRKNDLWLDLRKRWPFNNNSIKGFVAAHVIEHLFDEELEHFFTELKRVMLPGGFVHIEVPSLEILVENYQKDKNGTIFNEICFWHGAHNQIFDFNRLNHILKHNGFTDIKGYLGEKKSKYLSIDELNLICIRPDESLIVEALKVK